jgi:hypothetical protein
MAKNWFVALGWVYRPSSWPGYAVTAAALAFCVEAFVAVDRHSHSASDTLFGVFPFVVPAFLLLDWIASKTSGAAPNGPLPGKSAGRGPST